jgi:predicted Zn-dependent protease
MNKLKIYGLFLALTVGGSFWGCTKKNDPGSTTDNTINIFSLDDDKRMGAQTDSQILSDPAQFPILDPVKYATAYQYINNIKQAILNSGKLNHANDFNWTVRIINSDTTLNAFATPGGYIYVYTGIIKYLDSEDELAGVLGHEMAHADRRHVTDELTKIYGVNFLLGMIFGNDSNAVAGITEQLVSLKFSRSVEAEADKYSVIYLYPTDYDARGAARFFEKLIAAGQAGNTPVFLSDHPTPPDRVQAINDEWQSLGGKVGQTFADRYQQLKNSLPSGGGGSSTTGTGSGFH